MEYKVYTIGHFKQLYKDYRADDPNAPVSEYVDIATDLFVEIHKMIIRDTQNFKIPNACGSIRIVSVYNKAAVDNNYFVKHGVSKKILNLHSGKEIYKFKWNKDIFNRFNNARYYKYVPPLDYKYKEIGKRGLAKWIIESANDPKRQDFVPYCKT